MTKNDKKICEGCSHYIYNADMANATVICNTFPIKDNKKCPCSICIVKSMCTTMCDEFKSYTYFKYCSSNPNI